MGTDLVARLPLAQSVGTACVVLQRARFEPSSSFTFRPTEEQLGNMKTASVLGELYATFFGDHEGACLAYDVRFRAATPER